MIKGKINLLLRPIRLAFLVNPYKKTQVLEAIKLNTFLWGGLYNPIIPIPKRIPKTWKRELFRENLKSVVEGYIDAYDPDIIVNFDNSDISKFNFNDRRILDSKEILRNGSFKYTNIGISLYEILNQIYEDEFKFLKKHPIELTFPKIKGTSELFLSAVFGNLENKQIESLCKHYDKTLGIKLKDCNLQNFSTFLYNNNLFLRRIGDQYLKYVRNIESFSNDYAMVLDSNNTLDIIDYWNLRAAGVSILPLPIQSKTEDGIYGIIREFISTNYRLINQNNVYNETTLLKARGISIKEFSNVTEKLCTTVNNQDTISGKFISQAWYPRIWNELYRRYDHIGYCDTHSESKEIDISSNDNSISLETIYPKFSLKSFTDLGQYVNEIEINLSSTGSDLYAQAIPEAGKELNKAFGTWDLNKWRFSKNGIFHISEHKKDRIYFALPKSEEIFVSWFKSKDLEIKTSNVGYIAKQMIKRLGSIDGLRSLVNEEIVKLLIKFSKDNVELQDNNKTISFNELLEIANKAQNKDGFLWKAQSIFNGLINDNILQLGIRLQCTTCRQYSWYSLKAINYNLDCPNCLSDFPFPSTKPNKLSWRYKPIGPFSLGKEHTGVYCTLLCLTFFHRHLNFTPSTHMLSFDIVNEGHEIDLGIIIRRGYKSSGHQENLFFECKSYNEFERKDIHRMEFIAEKFPGAILVFASLKRDLSNSEKRLLIPFVKKCRKYYKDDKPVNPVLILTGNELFAAFSPPTCWKNLGEKYNKFKDSRINIYSDLFEFCDATQQIYLGMESWNELIRKKFKIG